MRAVTYLGGRLHASGLVHFLSFESERWKLGRGSLLRGCGATQCGGKAVEGQAASGVQQNNHSESGSFLDRSSWGSEQQAASNERRGDTTWRNPRNERSLNTRAYDFPNSFIGDLSSQPHGAGPLRPRFRRLTSRHAGGAYRRPGVRHRVTPLKVTSSEVWRVSGRAFVSPR